MAKEFKKFDDGKLEILEDKTVTERKVVSIEDATTRINQIDQVLKENREQVQILKNERAGLVEILGEAKKVGIEVAIPAEVEEDKPVK